MKKRVFVFLSVLLVFFGAGCQKSDVTEKDYGVFIGLSSEDDVKITEYNTLVIDAELFSKEEIRRMHQDGNTTIYSYLNIGSIEIFRECYLKFQSMTTGSYENWTEEYWMDVSRPEWREYIIQKAEELADKGVDGFFLDNADVWYHDQRPEIYQGLLEILQGLKQLELPLILNGGDTFVLKGLETDNLTGLIDGVNQENVFTNINFEHHTFGKQDTDTRKYYQEYLSRCKEAGLQVYLVEYGPSKKQEEEIREYCSKNYFQYYISPTLELNASPEASR